MSYNISVEVPCATPYLGPSVTAACSGSQFLIFMTLLDTLIRAKNDVSELCERVHPVHPGDSVYDFIIIGGGSAGAVVANRLSEIPEWKVLLLEAGPDEPPGTSVPGMMAKLLGTDIDWQYSTSNEKNACLSTNGSCSWPRGKNLGGNSVHNGMMYIRGHAKDYDDWVAMGNEGWSWEEVLPFFLKSENNTEIDRVGRSYHSTDGPLTVERFPWQPDFVDDVLAAAKESGFGVSEDLNGDQITGFSVTQTNSKDGVRVSSAVAFLRPIRDRSNLDIALNATATRIIIQDGRAVGVEYYQDGQQYTARANREVIVSGGAVNSPQLLLLSGIGPKEHLESVNVTVVNDLPGVGENLHNHISYTTEWTIDESDEYDLNWGSVSEYLVANGGPMSSTGMSQVTALLPSSYTTADHPDIQVFFEGYQAACSATGEIGALQSDGKRPISITPANTHPISRGTVRLASNDPFENPIIWGNYLGDEQDVAILVEGIQVAMALANTTALANRNLTLTSTPLGACSQYTFLSDEYWSCAVRQNTGPENHQAGSCKMGPSSDRLAVVDPQLKVHGIKGLRIADTSIMPVVNSGNTAAPAMMIGERAADFIKNDWGVININRFGQQEIPLLRRFAHY